MKSFAEAPLWAYDDTLSSLEALNDLVTTAMGSGEEFSRISYGVSILFDQQMTVLRQARDLIEHAAKAPSRATSDAVRHIEPAGFNMVMVTEPDGRRYMTTPALAGVADAGVTKPRFVDESAADTRKRVMAELAGDGEAAGEIAQATNLKRETVERVIGQLIARHDGPATRAANA